MCASKTNSIYKAPLLTMDGKWYLGLTLITTFTPKTWTNDTIIVGDSVTYTLCIYIININMYAYLALPLGKEDTKPPPPIPNQIKTQT